MHTQRILLVVTSSDRAGTAPEPTGLWLEEVAAPYYAFLDAKCDITIASPKGGEAPIDPRSNEESNQTASTRRFAVDAKAQHKLAHSMKLASVSLDDYDAIFYAGGHGTMDDFATDPTVTAATEHFLRSGKTLSAVCHGPAALVNARTSKGEPAVKGRRMTGFTDEEERLVGLDTRMPFLLESRLREQGATFSSTSPFQSHVVVDGNLITGQNPPSSIPVAEAVIHRLRNQSNTKRAA